MALSLTSNQKIALDYYIAAYGRAPAQTGLDFFGEKLDSGEMTEEQIRDYMMSNEEAQLRYPNTGTAEEQVNTVFKNVLGREVATDTGMKFYTDKLATDGYDMADLMAEVLAIAQNPDNYVDADTLRSKAEVAEYYLESVPADQQQNLPYYLGDVNSDNATVHQAHEAINGLIGTGLPISLTTKTDSVTVDGQFTDKGTATQAEIEGTDTLGVKTSVADDTINAPLEINGSTKKNTLNATDIIVDPSNKDNDKLDADLVTDLGTSGNKDDKETGPTITDIENITLHGTDNVNAYSLKNVTSTAEDDLATKDVNEGATISVNVDHGGTAKFISTTDIDLSTAVSNVDGNDIKEVNLIEDTRYMAVSEISNNPAINLTNGKIDTLSLDALDNAKLATEEVTVNLLNDEDGKLTLGLYDDNDLATAANDGGGFKDLNLVTSDAAVNVKLATGTHLRNGIKANALDTETDGGTPSATPPVDPSSEGDNGQIAAPAGGQDNLTDSLNLSGTKDITITGTDEQLDQAVVRSDMTEDATSTLALTLSETNKGILGGIGGIPQAVNLTDAEVDLVKVDASNIDRHGLLNVDRDFAQIAVDNDTTVEVNKIGDEGILNITGEAERTDDLDIIINTNRNDANNGRLVLGGDDLTQSETATSSTANNSTEATNNSTSTQGVDANNAALHVNVTDSTIDQLDISALLGMVTIDGDKDLNIEDGGLIFDDTTPNFNEPNNFADNTAADLDIQGENIGAGFGGDYVDATAMTGDLNIILRDGTSNSVRAALIGEQVTPMSNAKNGVEIHFGSGDDRITGLGTAKADLVHAYNEEAGDNVDMGAGDDTVIIGVNDTSTNLIINLADVSPTPVIPLGGGSFQTQTQRQFNALEDNDDTKVTSAENIAAVAYNTLPDAQLTGDMAYDRINAEVYLGEGSDTVIFRNQNSGFLADNNGVRIKDFEAGNNGDKMGFQMFQDGVEDGLPQVTSDNVVTQQDLNLFNNGQVIADSDVAVDGKYVINGLDVNGDGLFQTGDALDTGKNDGNVVLISTADIHKFTNSSASGLWASNDIPGSASGLFQDVVNWQHTGPANNGHQYETIVLVGETTGTDGVKIFYVTDECAPADPGLTLVDGVPTASLVGFLEGININDLEQDNFDFI